MGNPNPSLLRQLIDGTANKSVSHDTPKASESTPPVHPHIVPVAPATATAKVTVKSSPEPRSDVRETSPKPSANMAGHLKMLAESAPVAMAIFDVSMNYLYANHRWTEVFRLEEGDITGKNHYVLFPSLHPGWRHVYERALAGQIVRSDRDTVNQAGVPVLYRWEVRPWNQADASIGGLMISCLSIVGLKARDLADGAAGSTQVAAAVESGDSLWNLPLPIMTLNAAGCVLRSGVGATPLFLSSGLKEGQTMFWQLFGENQESSELCALTKSALDEVLSGRSHHVVVSLKSDLNDEDSGIPSTWNFTKLKRHSSGFDEDVVLCIGVHLENAKSVRTKESTLRDEAVSTDELAQLRIALKESGENEKNLRQREARLRAVLDAAPCGLLVIDERGRLVRIFDEADSATALAFARLMLRATRASLSS